MNTTSTKPDIAFSAYTIERTAKLLKLSFARILATYSDIDITVDQWVVLHAIGQSDEVNQTDISQHLAKDAPTITRIVDHLCQKQYVVRNVGNDRRQYQLHLTPAGRNMIQRITPLVHEFRSQVFTDITPHELTMMENVLTQVEKNLKSLK